MIRTQYALRCGYCGTSEIDIGAALTIDHFRPRSLGGTDDLHNLVYCCNACNQFKGSYWRPQDTLRILHPLFDALEVHFFEQPNGLLKALTETGEFHIQKLRLNRRELVAHRRLQLSIEKAVAGYEAVNNRVDMLEERILSLQRNVTDLSMDADETV